MSKKGKPASRKCVGRFRDNLKKARKRLEKGPLAFSKALSEQMVETALEESKMRFRKRKLTPKITLLAFLWQMLSKYATCEQTMTEVIHKQFRKNEESSVPSSGRYCEARGRLSLGFLKTLFRVQYDTATEDIPSKWKWLGRHDVKVVDGTTFLMADSQANRASFSPPDEPSPGTRYPMLRLVGIFSLATGMIRDFAYGPYQGKGTGESSLFRRLLHCLNPGDVVLGDKYYCSYRDAHAIRTCGGDIVVKHFSKRTMLQLVRKIGNNDAVYRWIRPRHAHKKMSREEFACLPNEILVRIVKVRVNVPGFRVKQFEVLTTLVDENTYSAQALSDLFFQRWRVETYLDEIKNGLNIQMLRCKTPEMLAKELTVAFLAYNTVRTQMAQVAECFGTPLNEISFTHTLHTMMTFAEESSPEGIALKLATIVHTRVGCRPGRSEPRAVKRGPSTHARLKQGRKEFTATS